MVDLHTHILPNIDDGASSYEEALNMLNMMITNGVTTVVATPHFNFEKNTIENFICKRHESLTKLKKLASTHNMPIEILSGVEIMFTTNLNSYNLNDFTIEGTDYLLIELSTRRNEPDLEYTLSAIIANGFIPILAHIERYSYLIQNSQRLINLIEMGVLMQINAESLIKNKRYPFIDALMKNNLVHIISSDAHDPINRVPNLKISEIKHEYAENQGSIILNQTLEVKKPKKLKRFLNMYF